METIRDIVEKHFEALSESDRDDREAIIYKLEEREARMLWPAGGAGEREAT